jgi:DNA-binding transcriptional ArsR family regulator
VLEQKLEEYEDVAKFLSDPASARILESLATQDPESAKH